MFRDYYEWVKVMESDSVQRKRDGNSCEIRHARVEDDHRALRDDVGR